MLFKKNDIIRLKEEYFDKIKSKLLRPYWLICFLHRIEKNAFSHEQADF